MSQEKDNPLAPGYLYTRLVNRDHPDFQEILTKSPGIHPFDIEDFLDFAKNSETIEKLKKFGFFQSVEQKVHSEDQVLTTKEIRSGMKFFLRQNYEVTGEITVTSEPYEDERGWTVIDCEGIEYGEERTFLPLMGRGVTQYPNGLWNAWNWLEKSDRIVAIFRDKVGGNLIKLQRLLDDYFETGAGSSLPLERQSYVAYLARRLVFNWTRMRLVQADIIDRNHMSSSKGVLGDLEEEFAIKSSEEIRTLLETLALTRYQKAGLRKRAWNLADKALESA